MNTLIACRWGRHTVWMAGEAATRAAEGFVARGRNGQLTVTPTKIVISREGFLGFMTHGHGGRKEIDISHITSIQFKSAGFGAAGFIQFAFAGGLEAKRGIRRAVDDENSVLFAKKAEADFVTAKD